MRKDSHTRLEMDVTTRSIEFLRLVVDVLEGQDKPSIANQGQCLDGFSALSNFNSVAEKIRIFLSHIPLAEDPDSGAQPKGRMSEQRVHYDLRRKHSQKGCE